MESCDASCPCESCGPVRQFFGGFSELLDGSGAEESQYVGDFQNFIPQTSRIPVMVAVKKYHTTTYTVHLSKSTAFLMPLKSFSGSKVLVFAPMVVPKQPSQFLHFVRHFAA